MICVTPATELAFNMCDVAVDEYISLKFKSYNGPLEPKYLRVGNITDSMLEFSLDPQSLIIRGFTLVAFDRRHEPQSRGCASESFGLPRLDMSAGYNFEGNGYPQTTDVLHDFSVGLIGNCVEIELCGIAAAEHVMRYQRVEFCLNENRLAGLRVRELNETEIDLLKRFHDL